jgi:hypothetical protein
MNQIFESFTDFCNEAKDNRPVLYKFKFKETFVNDDNKSHGPIWVLARDSEWSKIKKQACIEMSGGYGYRKNEEDAENKMKYEKEHNDDTTAGKLTPINKVGEIIKSLHKISKVKEYVNVETNNPLNESKIATAIMDYIENYQKNPNDKDNLEKLIQLSGVNDQKQLEDIFKQNKDAEDMFDAIMDL